MQETDRSKKAMLIAGVGLLQILLLGGAFLLGVFVTRTSIQTNPNQPAGVIAPQSGNAQQPAEPQPGQSDRQQQNILPGLSAPPQMIGHLVHISADTLELVRPQQPQPILVDAETTIETLEGEALTPADLQRDMILAVYGHPLPDSQQFLAERIVILPPPGTPPAN